MNINKYIIKICKQAVLASKKSGVFTASQKNNVLKDIANNIESDINNIIKFTLLFKKFFCEEIFLHIIYKIFCRSYFFINGHFLI